MQMWIKQGSYAGLPLCHVLWLYVSVDSLLPKAPFYYQGAIYWHGLTLIPAWISNYIHYNVWDEITYPFLNFNGATVEV